MFKEGDKVRRINTPYRDMDVGGIGVVESAGDTWVKVVGQARSGAIKNYELAPSPSALETQVGGAHYKKLKIQPVEYIMANNIPYMEGNVVKYVTRWRDKAGVQDLEKAKHYIEMLIEQEKKNA